MILSILICSLAERGVRLSSLIKILQDQIKKCRASAIVEILVEIDNREKTTGEKRNILMNRAKGKYVAFVDDDDRVPPYYVKELLNVVRSGFDCGSLTGVITFDGLLPQTFIHSIKYVSYFEKNEVYYRPPNHLNVIKKSIAMQFPFPNKTISEDTDFAMALCRSGKLKTEYWIERVMYFYNYKRHK